MDHPDSNALCLECGLCCNGVIFADGQLQDGDKVRRLQTLGLELLPNRQSPIANRKFRQPCAVYDGCRCRIYVERPEYCRHFECLLLKRVKAGGVTSAEARSLIRAARRHAGTVGRLLHQLGDTEVNLALSRRFQRMRRRLESVEPNRQTAEIFGQLTLAVHRLNMLLGETFYPPPRGG
jgi:uncharacterized protein